MADTSRRRPRRSTAVSQQLERMRRKKAELDAERREQERQEDEAIRQLARRAATVEQLERQRDAKIAELEKKIGEYQQRIAAVREATEARIEAEDRRHAPALRTLKRAGRSVEQIAALADRPPKHVRSLLREADGQQEPMRTASQSEPDEASGHATLPPATQRLPSP